MNSALELHKISMVRACYKKEKKKNSRRKKKQLCFHRVVLVIGWLRAVVVLLSSYFMCARDSPSISKAFTSPPSHVCFSVPPHQHPRSPYRRTPTLVMDDFSCIITKQVLDESGDRLSDGGPHKSSAHFVCMCVLVYCRANAHTVIINPCAAFYWPTVALILAHKKSDELQCD